MILISKPNSIYYYQALRWYEGKINTLSYKPGKSGDGIEILQISDNDKLIIEIQFYHRTIFVNRDLIHDIFRDKYKLIEDEMDEIILHPFGSKFYGFGILYYDIP